MRPKRKRDVMHLLFRHTLSVLMILVILSLSVTCFCSDHAAAEPSVAATPACGHCPDEDASPSPCHPDDTRSAPDQCHFSCGCYCHSQLLAEPLQIGYVPHTVSLIAAETFIRLPEVYLSKFVPPHILV